MIEIEDVGHIGIRVADEAVAMKFYELLGFKLRMRATGDAVTIMIPGITHIAYNVKSLKDTMAVLAENHIKIRQGPVQFPNGHVAIFIRDPDLNVLELRSHGEKIETEEYIP